MALCVINCFIQRVRMQSGHKQNKKYLMMIIGHQNGYYILTEYLFMVNSILQNNAI